MHSANPVLVDVKLAADVIDGLGDHKILHAGPPVEWPDMCGPMQGAVCGAIVLEGWAKDLQAAAKLAESGKIEFEPNHHHNAVGPMTGMTTQSMPLMVVHNTAHGNHAYCAINEGLGKVMRFGGNDDSVLERLRWLASTLGPLLADTLLARDGVGLKNVIARGLSMGDEMHQRNVACTSLMMRELAPTMARVADPETAFEVLEFIASNDQFFLNIAMAMGKAIMDPVRDIGGSSIVTAMSRNGTNFGIRVSGCGDQWFTAPVEMPRGLYFPGFTEKDANPDMGDSTIVETIGLGGFAMAASPAVAGFVGAGGAADAAAFTNQMTEITHSRNPEWTIPSLDFAGVPSGIDIRKVVSSGITPTINTGIAHREPGIGQVGAGIVNAPLACFEQACVALAERLSAS
ncbi:hypothetical protein AB833_16240 [Chromatiales bacterium (ex Bugula neritina AB1)]|nr:hypothetical protein AB833_16240 [Chromatiales bacterium (ex Bugula neritina AB1)]